MQNKPYQSYPLWPQDKNMWIITYVPNSNESKQSKPIISIKAHLKFSY